MALQHQDIVVVRLSEKERLHGSLTHENMGLAVSAMHRDGIVVLENAVDTNHCDELNRILVAEAEEMAKLPTTHFNEVRRLALRSILTLPSIELTLMSNRTQRTASLRGTCPKDLPSKRH